MSIEILRDGISQSVSQTLSNILRMRPRPATIKQEKEDAGKAEHASTAWAARPLKIGQAGSSHSLPLSLYLLLRAINDDEVRNMRTCVTFAFHYNLLLIIRDDAQISCWISPLA